MSNVVAFRKPSLKQKAQGKTLCKNGFHKWEVWQQKQFDVNSGKLVTVMQCKRCGKKETRLT